MDEIQDISIGSRIATTISAGAVVAEVLIKDSLGIVVKIIIHPDTGTVNMCIRIPSLGILMPTFNAELRNAEWVKIDTEDI